MPLMPTPEPRRFPLDPQDWFLATWRVLPPLPLAEPRSFEPQALLATIPCRTITHEIWESLKIPRSLTPAEAQFWLIAMTCPPALSSWGVASETLRRTLQEAIETGQCEKGQPETGQRETGQRETGQRETGQREKALTEEEALAVLGNAHYTASPQLILPLLNFFSPETIVDWILNPQQIPIDVRSTPYRDPLSQIETAQKTIANALVLGWQQFAIPYLSLEQRERCRQRVREVLDRTVWTLAYFNAAPAVYYLAASLGGFGEDLQRLIALWPDSSYHNLYQGSWRCWSDFVPRQQTRPQDLILGLADPQRVVFEMQRLGLRLNTLHYFKGWLAHTECQALPWLAHTVRNLQRKEDGVTLMRKIVAIVVPELAPVMLELTQHPPTAELAFCWLKEHPQVAMAGVLGSLQGQTQISKEVQKYVQRQVRRGEAPWMQAWVTEQLDSDGLSKGIRAELIHLWTNQAAPLLEADRMPSSLREGFASAQFSKLKLPKWVDIADFSPLQCRESCSGESYSGESAGSQGEERSFSCQQMETVIQACRQSKLSAPHPLIPVLKKELSSAGLAEFAWQLFERWLAVGAPSKDSWAMQTLGLLGNDSTVLQLTPLIRAWPKESKHKRAIVGVECLKAIGTDTALMQIHAIAQRIQFKSLKTKAVECMETLAQERGLTQEQLEDRIVPDCGLNAQGSKVYDYGSRQFRVVLSADLKPLIRDPQNKLKANLPRPTKQDDRALAEAAIEDWKTLKKTLGQVVSLQAKRLERAMIEQRHWERSEFETYLLGHPVLLNLARRLIWGSYSRTRSDTSTSDTSTSDTSTSDTSTSISNTTSSDTSNTTSTSELLTPFRITEDGSYADCTDEEIQIDPTLELGIVHPAELTTVQLQQWGQLLSDYEIVPPFSQLSRTVFGLLPEEQGKNRIERFAGAEVPTMIASAIFTGTGWQQSGYSYYKLFPQHNLTAIVSLKGWDQIMSLNEIYFVRGLSHTSNPASPSKRMETVLPLLEISPVVLSEVIRNIGAIASKADS